jgi:spermidine/putrescine transport system permease protein
MSETPASVAHAEVGAGIVERPLPRPRAFARALTEHGARWVLNAYLVMFFAYLFLPLLIMVAAGFNDYNVPSVTQWHGFTLRWVGALASDQRLLTGLGNSLVVAAGVVVLALPLGLAGALLLSRLESRLGGLLYGVLVSPILTPGTIIGISTLIFWRRVNVPGGLFLTIIAQISFIASFVMLLLLARLQRQDRALEDAALDLGASHGLVFRRITLPFLSPALVTAAVIAFQQSIENYNTTVFAIGPDYTLVTEIGSRLRYGLTPVVNVVGLLFIAVTVIAAVAWTLLRRRYRSGQ